MLNIDDWRVMYEAQEQDMAKLRASLHDLEFDQVLVIAQKSSLDGNDANQYRKPAYVAPTRRKAAAMLGF
jgi:hypothetical protein